MELGSLGHLLFYEMALNMNYTNFTYVTSSCVDSGNGLFLRVFALLTSVMMSL